MPLVPVTVVGGYLGAGKTTMIARLLARADGRRLAVLVNDFGALNLDAALLGAAAAGRSAAGGSAVDGSAGAADIVELTNGCVCCTMADSLGDGLDRVLALDPRPDQIVIEASGVADPGRIADYGRGWPGAHLDAVITVVDTTSIRMLADDPFVGSTVVRQLQAADVIALSHLDRLPPGQEDEVRSWLAARSPAPAVALVRGVVDPALLVSVAHPSPSAAGASDQTRPPLDRQPFDGHVADGRRPDGVRSVAAAVPDDVDPDRIAWLLDRWPPEVVRVKGIVVTADGGIRVVHRVGRRWSMTAEGAPTPTPEGALVVIALGPNTPGWRPPMPTTAAELSAQLMAPDPTLALTGRDGGSGPAADAAGSDDERSP
ncbi:MAG: CobW family GTP-binding protein [Actinomycetota bacterium]